MTLRMRLFLLLGALVAVLVAAEWWLVRTLARDLSNEIGRVAFRVGESVVATVALQGEAFQWVSPQDAVARDLPVPTDSLHPPESTAPPLVRRSETELSRTFRFEPRLARPRAAKPSALDALSPEETYLLLQSLEELRERHGPLSHAPRIAVVDREGRELQGEERRTAVEGGAAEIILALDSPFESRTLRLRGPSLDERIPIPHEGVEGALARFLERLLAYSGGLLLAGLALAAVIAHRATAPLRELSQAAREVGEGALGTRVQVGAAGEVGEAVAAFNAMSERLAELDAKARALSESKHLGEIGEVARGLAHGLRNPLHALGLSVEELASSDTDLEHRRELALAARRQIRRVDQSIRTFLALASSGGADAHGEIDLAELVEDVVLEVLQDARGRVQVAAEVEGTHARMRAVPAELRALVQALLVNAVEAGPDGSRVVLRLKATEGLARIEVDDEGPGLAPAVRAKLFTPHVTTKSTGAGMGLFLAHRIATTRLGGRLSLEDREGGGTRAVLELPLRPSADGTDGEVKGG